MAGAAPKEPAVALRLTPGGIDDVVAARAPGATADALPEATPEPLTLRRGKFPSAGRLVWSPLPWSGGDGRRRMSVPSSSSAAAAAASSASKRCWRDCTSALPSMLQSSSRNPYLVANVVYAVYAFFVVWIDRVAQARADEDCAGGAGPSCAASTAWVNTLWLGAAALYLANAFMFIWAWVPLGYSLGSVVMVPEYVNVLGAALYLYSASLYDDAGADAEAAVREVEVAAAAVEFVAGVGWCVTWWLTFPRQVAGRGWTLDDPDVWANGLVFAGSAAYVAYAARVAADPALVATDTLYVLGDIVFAACATFYVLSSLRDDGFFRFMPTAGACAHGVDAETVLDPMGTGNMYLPHHEQAGKAQLQALRHGGVSGRDWVLAWSPHSSRRHRQDVSGGRKR
jgi:hypothetical protein